MTKTKSAETASEREAREFIGENEPLLTEGGSSTLGHIIMQGSEIAVQLSGETTRATEELTDVCNLLADAIRDPKTPPKRMHLLEMKRNKLQKEYNRLSGSFERFIAFMDRANALYEERVDTAEELTGAPNPLREAVSGPPKRGFFARLFGRT